MLGIFGITAVVIALLATTTFQNAVLATVSRMLRCSAQSVIGQDRAYWVAHEADLPGEAFTLFALDEIVIHLISSHHYTRYRILIIRTRARQQRNCADRDGVVCNLRRIHTWRRYVEAVRTQTMQQDYYSYIIIIMILIEITTDSNRNDI